MKKPTNSKFPIFFFSIISFLFSCSTEKKSGELITEPYQAHVAFAGGGWRAHSGHAGWTIALLNNGTRTLDQAFANVGTLSSNSGGSWFSTMLMYSDDFDRAIQAPNADSTWAITGWLGLQEQLFNNAPCHEFSGDDFSACVGNYYSSNFSDPTGGLYWRKVVDKLVYKDYPIGKKLGDPVTGWAANKPLLLAASLLTSQVVLNRNYDQDNNYYQACLAPSTTDLHGKDGSSCQPIGNGPMPIVSPVTFSSIPKGSGLQAPPFLSAVKAGTAASQFNMGYTDDTFFASDTTVRLTTLQNPLNVSQVLVMDAAAASSAALGFGASVDVSGSFDESYALEDEALSFQLANSTVLYADPGDKGVEGLADQKFVRIADGGPVDNSGVAQLVSFLQQNNKADGFNIVAFDNVQQFYTPNGSTTPVGIDIANLFGQGICNGNQFCSGSNCNGTCITIPPLQIFVSDSLNTTKASWIAIKNASNPAQILVYTKYQVTTVANPTFGISAGSNGTLYTFSCIWENADTAPENRSADKSLGKITDQDFKAYGAMIKFISSSMQADNGAGLKFLEAAFGIGQ